MVKHIIKILFVFCFIFCAKKNLAQNLHQDTTHLIVNSNTNSISNSLHDTTKFKMKKSAWGAVLRSAVLPGFGQIYNESYWKVPLIWGVLGYLGYQWNSNNNLYHQYKDLYSESLLQVNTGNSNYYRYREFYRDQRDLFAIYIGLTFFLNLVDAYVDAHLFDFNVSNDAQTNSTQFNMHMRF